MTESKKLSLILFSGDFDKAVAAFTLASGAAAVGYEIHFFATFWGFNAFKNKKGHRPVGKGFLARFFNMLMGGFNNLPLSRLNFGGISPKLMTYMMKSQNVATLEELKQASVDLGVKFYACEMSMVIMGTELSDFAQFKEVLGVAKFLKLAEGGQVLFI